MKTVDPTQGLVWADLEVESKSLLQGFLETSGKHLISPARWKWLCHRVRSFFKLYLVCAVFVSYVVSVQIAQL